MRSMSNVCRRRAHARTQRIRTEQQRPRRRDLRCAGAAEPVVRARTSLSRFARAAHAIQRRVRSRARTARRASASAVVGIAIAPATAATPHPVAHRHRRCARARASSGASRPASHRVSTGDVVFAAGFADVDSRFAMQASRAHPPSACAASSHHATTPASATHRRSGANAADRGSRRFGASASRAARSTSSPDSIVDRVVRVAAEQRALGDDVDQARHAAGMRVDALRTRRRENGKRWPPATRKRWRRYASVSSASSGVRW